MLYLLEDRRGVTRVYKRKLNLVYDHMEHTRKDGVRYKEVDDKRLGAVTKGRKVIWPEPQPGCMNAA